MINLFKNTKPETTPDLNRQQSESSLHQIDSYLSTDVVISEIWYCLSKKWRKHCSWRTNFLEFFHKNFSNTDYQKLLEDFLHLCKSYKVEQLKKFQFQFEEHDFHRLSINSSILGRLFKEAFPYLQTLSLSFVNFRSPIQKDINSLMIVIGRHLSSLTKLKLSFEGCLLNDACLKMFESKSTGNYLKLTSLELSLANCSTLSNKGFVALFNDLTRTLNKLKILNLNFRKTCINDMSFDKLLCLINQRLLHLEVLNLDFTGCKDIMGIILNSLVHKTSNSGPQLTRISLILDDCTCLFDKGLWALGSLFQKHKKTLKNFHMSLNRCKQITERGFKFFIEEYLKSLENLKELELDFGMCLKVTDEVLEIFASVLRSFGGLEKLGLSLFACNGISDKGVKVLGDEIKKRLVNLKDLKLDFFYTNHVSKQVLNNLLEIFVGLARVNITFI